MSGDDLRRRLAAGRLGAHARRVGRRCPPASPRRPGSDRVPLRLLRLGHAARPARRRLPDAGRDGRGRRAGCARPAPRRRSWSTPTRATATRSTCAHRRAVGAGRCRRACSSRTRSGRSAAATWPASRWCRGRSGWPSCAPRSTTAHAPPRHGPHRRPRRRSASTRRSSGPGWRATSGVDALFVEAPESVAELERIARAAARHHPRRQHGRDGSDAAADAGGAGRPRVHADRVAAHRAVRDGASRSAPRSTSCGRRARCATTSTGW